MIKRYLCFLTALFLSNLRPVNADVIDIYIRDDVYVDYANFVNNRDVLSIKSYRGIAIRRDVIDMIIAQQALNLGGFNHSFHYIAGKVNFRNTKMLQTGELLMSFDSYWLTDAKRLASDIYISEPVIRTGEYIAGVYTSVKRQQSLKLNTLDDFSKLTAVSTPKWRTDWATLQELRLKELIREDTWLSMAQMVNIGWVDFMLMPFNSTPDQSFKLDKIHLVPVQNVAVQLNDSRHFVISRQHKYGEAAYHAIQKGLTLLRAQGTIKRAYTEAGFFVDKSQYKVLNTPRADN